MRLPTRKTLGLPTLVGVAWVLSAAGLQGAVPPGSCREGVIREIVVRNNSLWAPRDLVGRRLRWAMEVVNFVHVRTRQGFIRREMSLAEGDCYDAGLLAASQRNLRDLGFLARIDVRAETLPDSTWAVYVETWDEWSTHPAIDFDVEGELQLKGGTITEGNLFGTGLHLVARYRNFQERNDRLLRLSSGQLFGTKWDASIRAGTTRTGHTLGAGVAYPFVTEESRHAFEAEIRREDLEYAYLTGTHPSVSHVLLPIREARGEIGVMRRSGEPGGLFELGAEFSFLRRRVEGPARMVVGGDFDGAGPASGDLVEQLGRQAAPESRVRLGVTAGVRRLRFTTGRGLDLVSGRQTVALGEEMHVTVGRSVFAWGSASQHTYFRGSGFVGVEVGDFIGIGRFDGEVHLVDSSPVGGSPWRNLEMDGHVQGYLQPGGAHTHTLTLGARFGVRGNMDNLYQTSLGGEFGVRSYRETEVPIGSYVVTWAEHRWNLLDALGPVADLGLVGFADIGRGWESGIPFGVDTGWVNAVGLGVRVGVPAGTGSVARIEVAWPLGATGRGRSPVIRTYWAGGSTSR